MKKITLLFILLVTACTHVRIYEPTGLTPIAFWKDQELRRNIIKQVSTKLRLTYRGKQRTLSGLGRMVLQQKDKIRLELRDPFGRVHYMAVLNEDRFTAYYPRQGLAYFDRKKGRAYIKDFLGIDFRFMDLQKLLLGQLPEEARNQKMEDWTWMRELGQYRGTLRFKDYEIICYVDAHKAGLRKIIFNFPTGKIEARFSSFESCCKGSKDTISVGRLVELDLRRTGTSLEVEWENVVRQKTVRPESAFLLKLEKGTQRIFLK